MNYKEFLSAKKLNEAFKYSDEDKVINLIMAYFKKNLSEKVITSPYREKFYCNLDTSVRTGILFYTSDFKCFRLNWVGTQSTNFEFESVDIWMRGSKDPDYHYNVSGKSIAFILSLIVTILKKNSIDIKTFVANYSLIMFDDVKKEMVTESRTELEEDELSELLRQCYNVLITNQYKPEAIPENLAERTAVLLLKNVEPSETVDVNKPSITPQEVGEENVTPVELKEPEYKADVLSNIKNTANMIEKEFEHLHIENFTHKVIPSENAVQLEKKVATTFGKSKIAQMLEKDLRTIIDSSVHGDNPAIILSGTSGIGKTFSVKHILKNVYGLRENKEWVEIGGSIAPLGIYETLYDWKDDKIILFDDIDTVFKKDGVASNLLKKALDSYPVRKISWVSTSTFNPANMTEAEIEANIKKGKYPNNFEFTSSVIFITNIPLNKLDTAVVGRCVPMDLTFTEEEVMERIKEVLPNLNIPITLQEKETVLDLIVNSEKLYDSKVPLSIRTVEKACKLYVSAKKNMSITPDWKKFVLQYATQGI